MGETVFFVIKTDWSGEASHCIFMTRCVFLREEGEVELYKHMSDQHGIRCVWVLTTSERPVHISWEGYNGMFIERADLHAFICIIVTIQEISTYPRRRRPKTGVRRELNVSSNVC